MKIEQLLELNLSFDPNEQRDPNTGRWISGKTAIAGGAGAYIGHKLAKKKRLKILRKLRKSKQVDREFNKIASKAGRKGSKGLQKILKKVMFSKYGKKGFRKLAKKSPYAAEKLVGYLIK